MDARYFVRVYIECRKINMLPASGGPPYQTAFAIDLFSYLDDYFATHRQKAQEKQG